ncbi:alpha/beta fold hydrolase [Shimia marina]|uniref:AB hydrolase superfamily protein YdjP n=1 Tax=Shimia marina TaxID=321267 RepID=A0A0P1EP81_9RHOB|nr:alpha/beta hydrolase [Shimia marina]CUH52093.1 AB hydrolase superfamily protein YdjP [Shimia marina]SFE63762.1 Pimeloyl-ACP methyl ester carboxylesterase [Shimia marina]
MTPIVFLPGMMCDARLFAPQIAALSARHMVSVAPIGGFATMTELAQDVLQNAPPRFALAGLSMGGILAMEVARLAPERVAGLALMDTNPLAELEAVKAKRGPQIEMVRNGELRDVMRDQMIPHYLAESSDAATLELICEDMALALGDQVFINQSIALRDRPDQTETLKYFDNPALVLCGEQDRLCPVARHELMHELLPNSTLTVLPDAGHLPTLEQPQATTAALTTWLETL